ncbi:MAG: PEP-CTERM sorting domain-containing protein [Planctomycetales bacterium]|nr:PEP-CTERM sorting domain-containing protein [Planctomycetales bacterium]
MLRHFLCAGLLLWTACTAQGSLYFEETFTYPDGSLSANSGGLWNAHSGTTGQMQVLGGQLVVSTSNTEDVNRSIGTTVTSGSVYAGFDFSVAASAPAAGGDYEYFAHFGNGSTDFTSRMDIVAGSGAADFSVGIAGNSGTADATWATDLQYNTVYRAIIGYNRDTGITSLWINPASEVSTSIQSLADTNDVTGFYFRESTSSIGESISVDNLRVASTFGEALNAVPEPSTMSLLACTLGFAGLVRRRKVPVMS